MRKLVLSVMTLVFTLSVTPLALAFRPAGRDFATSDASGIGDPRFETGYSAPATRAKAGKRDLDVNVFDHGNPDIREQLMLELINRARAAPAVEAARLGIDLNEGLAPGTITDAPKPPLAFHPDLIAAARNHSQWMLDTDTFSHTGVDGTTAGQRMERAGYVFSGSWSWGENIAWGGSTGAIDIDSQTRSRHESLFRSPGHRVNICGDFDEVGVGIRSGEFSDGATTYNAAMVTQKLSVSGSTPGPLLLGVVYEDCNGNGAYDPGEGNPGVTVFIEGGAWQTETSTSGGYALPYQGADGLMSVTFSGGTLAAPVAFTVEKTGFNVKRDLDLWPLTDRLIRLTGDLDFGGVALGEIATRVLTIHNDGNGTLTVSAIIYPVGFSGVWSGTIPAGGYQEVTVLFTPSTAVSYGGTLTVNSDKTTGTYTYPCSGTGAAASAWDADYTDLGGGWRRLAWFGDYIPMGVDGWIWHGKHGFFYVPASSTSHDVWLFSQDMGWLYTGNTTYPFLYRASDGAWLWYNGATNPRWFRNMATGQWERWP